MESKVNYIQQSLTDSIALKQAILLDKALLEAIQMAAEICITAFRSGNRILIAGNGGSAADAQHIAAEFVSRFMYDRPGLPAIALTTDTSMLTAIGNDYGFERLFERQLEANARRGDVFIGISTSGNSANIARAIKRCKDIGVTTIGLLGNGGVIHSFCDHVLAVPSNSTPRIQEVHITIGHIICGLVESAIFPISAS